jgi:hypothetical protein
VDEHLEPRPLEPFHRALQQQEVLPDPPRERDPPQARALASTTMAATPLWKRAEITSRALPRRRSSTTARTTGAASIASPANANA